MTIISEAVSELPSDLVKAAKQLRALVDSKAKEGRKQVGAGTVVVVADGARESDDVYAEFEVLLNSVLW